MTFTSFTFAVFLPIVFVIYWMVLQRSLRIQNLFVVAASYVFYGWWDWRFLSLIIFSSLIDFLCGIGIEDSKSIVKRRALLALSLFVNLGALGVFKYFNFFAESLVNLLNTVGVNANPTSLDVILPVGISFYTFQTLSYTIDIYRGNLRCTRNWVAFFAYVAFFPQLVAGPIERTSHLLPQFLKSRTFDYNLAMNGVRQIVWGFFKKVAIADNCAIVVNELFAEYESVSTPLLILGAVLFAFQIYCDFSGYSDIAIGSAKLFGFDLMANFRYPYFSRDIAEFWRRWHISLSTWFRDYLYIPLGGSRGESWRSFRNVFVIFVVSGLWHGANWTFVMWGVINAMMFLPLMLTNRNRNNLDDVAGDRHLPTLRELQAMITTFIGVCFGWIFFRSESVSDAVGYIRRMFSSGDFTLPNQHLWLLLLIGFLVIFEWMHRRSPFPMFKFRHRSLNVLGYFSLIYVAVALSTSGQEFIYFQF